MVTEAYLRELADRLAGNELTDEDEFVLDAIDDARDEWSGGPPSEHIDEIATFAAALGISPTDFIRHAVGLQVEIMRNRDTPIEADEGAKRLADLARWIESRKLRNH